ncbi:MAG: TonB family protein [Longimicrobiales bacterium]
MTGAAALVAALGLLQAPAVQGVVRSSDGDEPIAYAQIRVVNHTAGDWTNARGEYRLEGLEPGRWELRILHTAHDSLDLEVFVPRGDRSLRLDITLNARAAPTQGPLHDFEPFQVEYTLPSLLNSEEVTRRIQARYPPELVRQGIGGEAVLRLWLDERGQVVRTIVSSSTGIARLDSIAVAVSDRMRFRPARSGDHPARVIVRIPVTFTVPDSTLLRIDSAG